MAAKRAFSSLAGRAASTPSFGLMFDIDGVLVRGRKPIPAAVAAFKKLTSPSGQFRVPTIFVTNAGDRPEQGKAEQLSQWLQVPISPDQVVMAPSPLKMFRQYHDKHALVVGSGPVLDIAQRLGFRSTISLDQVTQMYPALDAIHFKLKRGTAALPIPDRFPTGIEALVLFGEPAQWETALQLLLDVLVCNGQLSSPPSTGSPYADPHLPVLACNMDLQYMSEAPMPRFGNGAFLLCLESLYHKVTSRPLVYSCLLGKPSEITFHYSNHVLQSQAKKLGLDTPLRNLYFVGDNVCTDIVGANLYHRYLQDHQGQLTLPAYRDPQPISQELRSGSGAEHCYSVLVQTGVYSPGSDSGCFAAAGLHSHRDFTSESMLDAQRPAFVSQHVLDAVNLIFQREQFT